MLCDLVYYGSLQEMIIPGERQAVLAGVLVLHAWVVISQLAQ